MRLDINLATRPYEDARQFWLRWGGGIGLLGILTLALLYAAFAGWSSTLKDRRLEQQYENQIAARDQERARAQAMLDLPQNREVRDRSQFLNALFERKAFSWTRVFEELERVMPGGLHVVSIAPKITPGNALAINLDVAGTSRESALELVRRMESSPSFRQTQIDEESPGSASNTSRDTVKFRISALYVPQAPETNTGASPALGAGPSATATRPRTSKLNAGVAASPGQSTMMAMRPAMHPSGGHPPGWKNPAWQKRATGQGGTR